MEGLKRGESQQNVSLEKKKEAEGKRGEENRPATNRVTNDEKGWEPPGKKRPEGNDRVYMSTHREEGCDTKHKLRGKNRKRPHQEIGTTKHNDVV